MPELVSFDLLPYWNVVVKPQCLGNATVTKNVQACYPIWCFYFFLFISWTSTVVVVHTAGYVRLFTFYLWKSRHICLGFFLYPWQASQMLLRPTLVRVRVFVPLRKVDIHVACVWSKFFEQADGPMSLGWSYLNTFMLYLWHFYHYCLQYLAEWMKAKPWT